MLHIAKDRREALFVGVIGIAAAFFLLDKDVSPWLRILPWVLVFAYPLARMMRGLRQRRS
jgi:hypothetical protein